MNEVVAGLPWSVIIPLLGVAASYGALNWRAKQTSNEVDDLRMEHRAMILEARKISEQTRDDMNSHRLHVSDNFAKKVDLGDIVSRLEDRFDDMKDRLDELKMDIGKKGIEHAIKNAIATALAPDQINAIRSRRS